MKDNSYIYLYPNINLEEKEIQLNCKVILLVGQTGSGKSTMIDLIINYLMGIDFDDVIRYKLVDERELLTKSSYNNSESLT
jgi:polynucleotide 5'-kinase involved in rRNA processing